MLNTLGVLRPHSKYSTPPLVPWSSSFWKWQVKWATIWMDYIFRGIKNSEQVSRRDEGDKSSSSLRRKERNNLRKQNISGLTSPWFPFSALATDGLLCRESTRVAPHRACLHQWFNNGRPYCHEGSGFNERIENYQRDRAQYNCGFLIFTPDDNWVAWVARRKWSIGNRIT